MHLLKSRLFFISLHRLNKLIMDKKRILYISSEITPFTAENEISAACRKMILTMQDSGHEIRSFMPKWGPVNERRNQLHEVIRLSGMNLIIDDTDHPLLIKVASVPGARAQVYFIDNDDYFINRKFTADENGVEYTDNDERAIFFARGVLETVKKLRWAPDIIHCRGWISALIPMYIKAAFKEEPAFRDSKVVYSLCNDRFAVPFRDNWPDLMVTKDLSREAEGQFCLPIDFDSVMRKAIEFADGVIEAAPGAADAHTGFIKEKGCKYLGYELFEQGSPKLEEFYSTLF